MKRSMLTSAILALFFVAVTSVADAGLFDRLLRGRSHHAASHQGHQHQRGVNDSRNMRSDYRGAGRQPGYRGFYRYNAFFPGHNFTSPYGYDYN
ncbi:MAG: hypothetical protein HOL01_21045 [Planctomycetaceae bacterium]|nr:hypothetical protein [Planctomycetaceae bacterium]MBT6487286.1 hypothetical protein [Planctomycetaceae bacterium]MBT6497026.1 hypothetical protein [Planctomycetaceae bacterium]